MPLRPPRSGPSVHPWPRRTLRGPRLGTPSAYKSVEVQCEPRIPTASAAAHLGSRPCPPPPSAIMRRWGRDHGADTTRRPEGGVEA